MPAILIGIKGKLTERQKKSICIIEKILSALIKEEPLDWKGLLEKKICSQGALDKWLKELVEQDVVKGEVKVVKTKKGKRLIPFYTYNRKHFWIEGKEKIYPQEVCRIYFTEKGIVDYEYGYLKKGKGRSLYFVTSEGKKPH